jgi:hypothetical protein
MPVGGDLGSAYFLSGPVGALWLTAALLVATPLGASLPVRSARYGPRRARLQHAEYAGGIARGRRRRYMISRPPMADV